MGLLDRLNLLIRSELGSRREDRHGDDRDRDIYERSVAEMDTTLREARARVKEVLADERRLEQDLDDSRQREQSWEDEAMQRLKAGDEPGAREALQSRNTAARQTRRIRAELDAHRVYLADLLRGLEALEKKLDAVRTRGQTRRAAARAAPGAEGTPHDRQPTWHGEHRVTPGRAATSDLRPDTDDIRRWEALVERGSDRSRHRSRLERDDTRARSDFSFEDAGRTVTRAMGELDATLERFGEYEDKIERLEAEVAAQAAFDAPLAGGLDEDDPLYDPKLADLERRFRELERADRDGND